MLWNHSPALHVPARRQHDYPAVVERRQVMLDAAAAEGVLDAVLLRFAGQVRLGDEERDRLRPADPYGCPRSVTGGRAKSPTTVAAVAGCSIRLWRPSVHASWTVPWHEAQVAAPTIAAPPPGACAPAAPCGSAPPVAAIAVTSAAIVAKKRGVTAAAILDLLVYSAGESRSAP